MKTLCFTGDMNKLEDIGYKFIPESEEEIPCYMKNNIFISAEENPHITFVGINYYQVENIIKFINENKDKNSDFWERKNKHRLIVPSFVAVPKTDENGEFNNGSPSVIIKTKDFEEKKEELDKIEMKFLKKEMTKEEYNSLSEKLKGSIYDTNPFVINIKFVNQILELEELGGIKNLELV